MNQNPPTKEIAKCKTRQACDRSSSVEMGGIEHVKKLWILLQVVETGSFRKAALRAKISAPAVSQAIGALEQIVGKKLLFRSDKGVKPTPEGLAIVNEAAPAIRKLWELSALNSQSAPKISWISFGTYESLAVDLLPRLVTHFREKIPNTKVTLRVARTATLATMVRKGELCAALVSESDCFGGLTIIPVGEDRLGFFASASHKSLPKNITELQTRPIGFLSPGTDGLPLYFKKFIQATVGEKIKSAVVSDSFEALRATACGSETICLLPSRVAARNPGELVEIKLDLPAKALGVHKLFLIAEPKCDLEELKFLETELSFLLAQRPAYPAIQ